MTLYQIFNAVIAEVSKTISFSNQLFEKIISRKKNCLIFLCLALLIFGVFANIIMGHTTDPGNDGAFYLDIAENIKEGRGNTIDAKYFWYDWETDVDDGQISQPNWGVVVYPFFQSLVMFFDDSLLTFIFINLLFSTVTIAMLFLIFSELFDNKIALISSLIFIFNPLFFSAYTTILSEALYLLLYTFPFYILFKVNNDNYTNKTLLFVGLLSGTVFLTRFVGLIPIMSIFLWFLLNKKNKEAIVYAFSTGLIILPWFIWNKFSFGVFLPYTHMVERHWPVAGLNDTEWSGYILVLLREIFHFGMDFSSINMFFILAPFVFLGLFIHSTDKKLSLIVIFSILTLIFHLILEYRLRYMVQLVPLLIPLGVSLLDKFCEKSVFKSIGKRLDGDKFFAIIVLVILLFSLLSIGDMIKDQRFVVENDYNEQKYEWLETNSLEGEIICSTAPRHAHYFTNNPTINLAFNLNQTWLDVFIDSYNISFIVIEETSFYHYTENVFLQTLFEGNEKYILGKNMLLLVHEELGHGNDILFYQVVKI